LIIQSDEKREDGSGMITYAPTHAPCCAAFPSEADKSLVNGLFGQYRAAIICACRYKIDRCAEEDPIKAL
jgi:hypothetical protein